MGTLDRVLPAAQWVRGYGREKLSRDLVGGVAVGFMLVPQGLAFAQLVGISPVAGLWSGIAAMLAYALVGPSRHLIVGPEAGTAMMVAAVLTSAGLEGADQRLEGAALLSLMVSATLVLAACLRLSAISDFLSRPILVGYIHAIALVLIASQLPAALGLASSQRDFLPQVLELARRLGGTHAPTLALSACALALLLLLRKALPRLPGAVVVLAGGTAACAWLGLEGRGVRVLGPIEQGLPAPGLPSLPVPAALRLAPGALSIALLVYASTVLTSRAFASTQRDAFKANRELFGLAASNLAAGLVHGVPAAGSDARTVINVASGARTQAAGLVASGVAVAVILLLGPVMRLVPVAVLACVVIASAVSLVDLRSFVRIFRLRPVEGLLAVATFVGVLVFGILPGVLVAVGLSIADLIRRAAHPHDAVLGRLAGRRGYHDIERRPESETLPGLVIYRIDAPLFFANARFLRERVHALIEAAGTPVRMVVLDCGAMFDLDVTAAETLEELDREFDARGITLALAEPHAPMRRVLRRSGLLQKIGEQNVFATVEDAIRAYVARAEADLGPGLAWRRASHAPSRPTGPTP